MFIFVYVTWKCSLLIAKLRIQVHKLILNHISDRIHKNKVLTMQVKRFWHCVGSDVLAISPRKFSEQCSTKVQGGKSLGKSLITIIYPSKITWYFVDKSLWHHLTSLLIVVFMDRWMDGSIHSFSYIWKHYLFNTCYNMSGAIPSIEKKG